MVDAGPVVIWLARIGILLALLAAAYFWGRCGGDDFNSDQPAEVIDSLGVVEEFDFGPEIPLLERPFRRNADVRRAGVAPGAAQAAVDSFVAAAIDSAAPPVFPPVRGRIDGDRLSLRLPRSDGAYVAQEFDCPDPCDFGAQDTLMFAHHDRALPRLLPGLLKGAAICTAVAGAGYGVARLADFQEPLAVAGASGVGCVLLKVVG